jgi:hypothetical protein
MSREKVKEDTEEEREDFWLEVESWMCDFGKTSAETAKILNAPIKKVKMFHRDIMNRKLPEKEKAEQKLQDAEAVLESRIKSFRERSLPTEDFGADEVRLKIGDQPKCYITGLPLNLDDPDSYSFDHIVPVAFGGASTLDNLEVCTPQVNRLKSAFSLADLVYYAKLITKNTRLKKIMTSNPETGSLRLRKRFNRKKDTSTE